MRNSFLFEIFYSLRRKVMDFLLKRRLVDKAVAVKLERVSRIRKEVEKDFAAIGINNKLLVEETIKFRVAEEERKLAKQSK